MVLTLQDISTLQGESRFDPNGEIVLGGKGSALIKNPSNSEVAIFQINKLGWLGDWISSESVSLQPGTETKVGGDGTGRSVVSLQWEPVETAPTESATQADPPIVTDFDNVNAAIASASQGAVFWIILAIVLLALGYFALTFLTSRPGVPPLG